jgi:hypothetical protein
MKRVILIAALASAAGLFAIPANAQESGSTTTQLVAGNTTDSHTAKASCPCSGKSCKAAKALGPNKRSGPSSGSMNPKFR